MKIRVKLIWVLLFSLPLLTHANYERQAFDTSASLGLRWKSLILGAREKGASFIPQLNRAATSRDWFMRNAALIAMSETDLNKSYALARKLLKDDALVVRSAAVKALENSSHAEDRLALIGALQDKRNIRHGKSLWIRPQIVKILSRRPDKGEIKTYLGLLKENDPSINPLAIDALEKISPQLSAKNAGVRMKRSALLRHYQSVDTSLSL